MANMLPCGKAYQVVNEDSHIVIPVRHLYVDTLTLQNGHVWFPAEGNVLMALTKETVNWLDFVGNCCSCLDGTIQPRETTINPNRSMPILVIILKTCRVWTVSNSHNPPVCQLPQLSGTPVCFLMDNP